MSNILRIMFEKNNVISRTVANDWISGILENDLRSTMLADKVLEMTKTFGKDSPRRVLAYKVAAMCGDVSIKDLHSICSKVIHFTQNFGRREYIRVLRAKREQLAHDLSAIPDLRYVEWGRGSNMGKFVPKGAGNR